VNPLQDRGFTSLGRRKFGLDTARMPPRTIGAQTSPPACAFPARPTRRSVRNRARNRVTPGNQRPVGCSAHGTAVMARVRAAWHGRGPSADQGCSARSRHHAASAVMRRRAQWQYPARTVHGEVTPNASQLAGWVGGAGSCWCGFYWAITARRAARAPAVALVEVRIIPARRANRQRASNGRRPTSFPECWPASPPPVSPAAVARAAANTTPTGPGTRHASAR
jgi:hypothetical protein